MLRALSLILGVSLGSLGYSQGKLYLILAGLIPIFFTGLPVLADTLRLIFKACRKKIQPRQDIRSAQARSLFLSPEHSLDSKQFETDSPARRQEDFKGVFQNVVGKDREKCTTSDFEAQGEECDEGFSGKDLLTAFSGISGVDAEATEPSVSNYQSTQSPHSSDEDDDRFYTDNDPNDPADDTFLDSVYTGMEGNLMSEGYDGGAFGHGEEDPQ